jgi:hypothetical protein
MNTAHKIVAATKRAARLIENFLMSGKHFDASVRSRVAASSSGAEVAMLSSDARVLRLGLAIE